MYLRWRDRVYLRDIAKTLTREERTKLKLENPIGVAEHLLEKYKHAIQNRRKVLDSDVRALDNITAQIEEYKKVTALPPKEIQKVEILDCVSLASETQSSKNFNRL